MAKKSTKENNTKPNFEEWYNGLSKPARKAFKVGVLYALKMQKEQETLKAILKS